MLEAEMTQHLGYEPYQRSESPNARNGRKVKTIHSKYWLGIFDNLKNRGVKDILILCTDGLSEMKEAVAVAFPKTEYQAPSEQIALKNLEKVTEKWKKIYQSSMKNWTKNWDVISPIFKFSMEVRKVICTTNAIESLNNVYRHLNSQRSVFPSDTSLLKHYIWQHLK